MSAPTADRPGEDRPAEDRSGEQELGEAHARALGEYEEHLRWERHRSPRTIAAYLGDLADLMRHAQRRGRESPEQITLEDLRDWLAGHDGAARTSSARRASAARGFFRAVYFFPVLLSPVYGRLDPARLAEWILRDRLPVRLQIQLHKVLWGEAPGH